MCHEPCAMGHVPCVSKTWLKMTSGSWLMYSTARCNETEKGEASFHIKAVARKLVGIPTNCSAIVGRHAEFHTRGTTQIRRGRLRTSVEWGSTKFTSVKTVRFEYYSIARMTRGIWYVPGNAAGVTSAKHVRWIHVAWVTVGENVKMINPTRMKGGKFVRIICLYAVCITRMDSRSWGNHAVWFVQTNNESTHYTDYLSISHAFNDVSLTVRQWLFFSKLAATASHQHYDFGPSKRPCSLCQERKEEITAHHTGLGNWNTTHVRK